jgi:hypothetical protein
MHCAPRELTLAEARQRHPHLARAVEVRVQMNHAFAPYTTSPCWQWSGWLDDKGYGRMAHGDQRAARVHRVTYELIRGYVLESQVLDHLCRNRACCNPWHLQPITQTENTQRGARAEGICRNGLHRMEGDNVIVRMRDGLPRYECRACKEARRIG